MKRTSALGAASCAALLAAGPSHAQDSCVWITEFVWNYYYVGAGEAMSMLAGGTPGNLLMEPRDGGSGKTIYPFQEYVPGPGGHRFACRMSHDDTPGIELICSADSSEEDAMAFLESESSCLTDAGYDRMDLSSAGLVDAFAHAKLNNDGATTHVLVQRAVDDSRLYLNITMTSELAAE